MKEDRESRGRGFRGGGRGFPNPPVEEGKTYEVEIDSLGKKGDGIGRLENFVVVVPNTRPGDRVKVKITAVRGKVSFGEVEETL